MSAPKFTLLRKRSIGGDWEVVFSGSHQRIRGYVARQKRRMNGDSDTSFERVRAEDAADFLASQGGGK